MARNLDEFARELAMVTESLKGAAVTRAQTRAVVDAAASGGADAVRRLAESMSTADLQRVMRDLQR
ncbi:hypothetical protein [Streptomyces jumonjinensis]|uniref:hypothetical protein n=1 Tax=Streptomyces jumonjinensis TaxID=1945 RepID=UPI0037AF81B6